ncbi:MAG: hypothetical protein CVV50_04185, partial [Spirochaetae bacterium HGW-Spirochaetae-6]
SYLSYFKERGLAVFEWEGEDFPEGVSQKTSLWLTARKGGFVNPCPCSPHMVCCGYHNINLIEGCPFSCNYCALDAYLSHPLTRIFANLEDFEQELAVYLSRRKSVRIGTGELTDSLFWDKIFPYSGYLMDTFAPYRDSVILEFKTKSNQIDHLLAYTGEKKHVLISFSVNTRLKIAQEEKDVASLDQRLAAATEASRAGYKVGFHFDPVYYYPGWEKEYQDTVKEVLGGFSRHQIGWVSVGVLRFAPPLKELLYQRSKHVMEMEIFPSSVDGKMRLFYPKREEVLLKMLEFIRIYTDKVYLCMEPPEMWKDLALDDRKLNQRIFEDYWH